MDRPLLAALARLRLASPRAASGSGSADRPSRALGRGQEFADHRAWTAGDDLRLVDWNVYARLGSVLVRLFHEDRNLRVAVSLDATGSMAGEKLRHGAELAGALAFLALRHRDAVTLATFGARGDPGPLAASGIEALPALLDHLDRVEAGASGEPRRALLAGATRRRADRAFLVSDLLVDDATLEATLRTLAVRAVRPVLLHVLGEEDLTPDLTRPGVLVDAESGEELEVAGGPAAHRAYEEALTAWTGALRARCARWGVRYVEAFTRLPARDLFFGALRREGVVEGAR